MNTSTFSIEQMAGQRLMVGFDGTRLDSDLKYLIDSLKVGGLILFSRNLTDPEQIRTLCASAQNHARASGQPPLLIAVDQEGGQVARLKDPFTRFPGNPHITCRADADRFARVTGKELGQVGINMNMAPVMDVAPSNIRSVMAKRVFGEDPDRVALFGTVVIDGLQKAGIMAVAKHFPGIGRTTSDSHVDMPTLDVDAADLASFDLPPFEAAVANRVSGIMLSHIRYSRIDPDWPASLSRRIAGALLRDEMGYDGIVLTDDLDMGAIAKHYDIRTVIRRILSADIDIALICHRSSKMETAFEEIQESIKDSGETASKAARALERILRVKQVYVEGSRGL